MLSLTLPTDRPTRAPFPSVPSPPRRPSHMTGALPYALRGSQGGALVGCVTADDATRALQPRQP
jgi:hypothetical protein